MSGLSTYLLVFLRLSGLIVTLPAFSNAALPRILRVGIAALLTLLIAPIVAPCPYELTSLNIPLLALSAVSEVALGACVGYVFTVVVAACGSAGSLMDIQAGLSNSAILNPSAVESGSQTLLSTFFQTISVFCLLQADTHLVAIEALVATFAWSPVGLLSTDWPALGAALYGLTLGFFASTLSIAFPVLLGMLCVEVVLAFLSRLLPSLNMLVAAAPIRVLIGLSLVSLSLPLIFRETQALIQDSMRVLGVFRV